MKNIKRLLSIGMALVVATSSQVKGMQQSAIIPLTQNQKAKVLEYMLDLNQKISNLQKQIDHTKASGISYQEKQDAIFTKEDQINIFENQRKKLHTILHDERRKAYTNGEIEAAYKGTERLAKNPYLTEHQVERINFYKEHLLDEINDKTSTEKEAMRKGLSELDKALANEKCYTTIELNKIYMKAMGE
jgi:hypothetical protein